MYTCVCTIYKIHIINSYNCYPYNYICTLYKIIVDVNECTLNIDDCDQLCVDDIGSYHCECYTGYFRDNNSAYCVGKCLTVLQNNHCIAEGRPRIPSGIP